jgi:hypothetical protein
VKTAVPLRQLVFGRPLLSTEEKTERIGVFRGVPILGLDALSSAAYGPERRSPCCCWPTCPGSV